LGIGLDSWAWAEFRRAFWMPVSFFKAFNIGVLPGGALRTLDVAFYVSSIMASIGLFSRVSMATSAGLALYLFGLQNDFGKVSHAMNIAVVFAFFLAISRAADRLSVDAILRHLLKRPLQLPEHSGEYTWPIRVSWLCVVVMYGSAGISKWRHSGIEWATTDNLKLLLLRHQYSHTPPTRLGVWIAANYPASCHLIAGGAMTVETLCPLALFHRYLRFLFGVGLCGMQIGIYLMMGILFELPILMIIWFWVPWGPMIDWVILRLRQREVFGRRTAALLGWV
jgi:hypothetical protein